MAHRFQKRFNGGRGIEGIGVPPHVVTPYKAEELRNGIDSQIREAEEWLERGLPATLVAWQTE